MVARKVREHAASYRSGAGRRSARVLVDTNVVIDLLLDRAPWSADAAELFNAIAVQRIRGFVAPQTVTTTAYLIERERNRRAAMAGVANLLSIVEVVPIDTRDCQAALALSLADYEDALQVVAAMKVDANAIATRNLRDFRHVGLPVLGPAEAVATFGR